MIVMIGSGFVERWIESRNLAVHLRFVLIAAANLELPKRVRSQQQFVVTSATKQTGGALLQYTRD